MVYSDVTNLTGGIQFQETLLDLGNAGISGNTILLQQITTLNNVAYDDAVFEIMKNEGQFTWDDNAYGNANLPVGTQNLTTTPGSEVSNYPLPNAGSPGSTDASSFLRLIQVQVKDAGGNWQKVNAIDESAYEYPLENIFQTPNFPLWYKMIGTSIVLYPAPLAAAVTSTGGLKMIFQRDKIDFVYGDTTKQPGFPSIYHPLLFLLGAEAWAAIKGMRQLPYIQEKIQKFYVNIGWGIANRDKSLRQRIMPRTARSNPNMM